jgi:ketosteroid isomerase-like protein
VRPHPSGVAGRSSARDAGVVMAQDRVEIVRAALEAFNATQRIDVGGLTEDVAFSQPDGFAAIGEDAFHGRDGFVRGVREVTGVFDDFTVDAKDFAEMGDRVLVTVRISGQAHASGVPLDREAAYLVTFRGARIARWDIYEREMPGGPDAGVFTGRAAALARMKTLIDLLGPIQVHLDELIDLGDGRLVACVRMVGESAASDPPYTQSFAVVHRVRDGLIREADYYLDRAQALNAVGLGDG